MSSADKKSPKTLTGLDLNMEKTLCYMGFWLTGLFFLIASKQPAVRFHAMQSVAVFGLLFAAKAIPVLGSSLSSLLWIIIFISWLVLIVKTYQGDDFVFPIVGEFVKKRIKF